MGVVKETPKQRIAKRQEKVRAHTRSFLATSTEEWKSIQEQQAQQKKEIEAKKIAERKAELKEQQIKRGLSRAVKERFEAEATYPEKKELTKDTRIKTISIGTKGTLRYKHKGEVTPTELQRVERRKGLEITRTYLAGETREPIQISERKEKIRTKGDILISRIGAAATEVSYRIMSPIGVSGIYAPKKIIEAEKKIPILRAKTELERGFVESYITEWKERPLKMGIITAASFVLQPIIAGVQYGKVRYVAPLLGKAPKVEKVVKISEKIAVFGVKYGLPTAYFGAKGIEIVKAPTYRAKGEVIGRAGAEITAFAAGTYIGGKVAAPIQYKTIIEKELLGVSPAQRGLVRGKLAEVRRLARTTEVEPRRIQFEDVERLPKKAARVVERYILEHKAELVVGGSVAQRTQLAKGLGRRAADIDIYSKAAAEHHKGLLQALKKAGVERVAAPRVGEITIGGKKAIEVKEMERMIENIASVQRLFLKPTKFGIAKTPRGIQVMKLEIQAQRKVIAAFLERRMAKDVYDVGAIIRSYHQEIKYKPTISFKIGKKGMLLPETPKVSPPSPQVMTDKIGIKQAYKPFYKKYQAYKTKIYAPYKKPREERPYKISIITEPTKPYISHKIEAPKIYKPSVYKPRPITEPTKPYEAPYKPKPTKLPIEKPYTPYEITKPIIPIKEAPPLLEFERPRKKLYLYEKKITKRVSLQPSLIGLERFRIFGETQAKRMGIIESKAGLGLFGVRSVLVGKKKRKFRTAFVELGEL